MSRYVFRSLLWNITRRSGTTHSAACLLALLFVLFHLWLSQTAHGLNHDLAASTTSVVCQPLSILALESVLCNVFLRTASGAPSNMSVYAAYPHVQRTVDRLSSPLFPLRGAFLQDAVSANDTAKTAVFQYVSGKSDEFIDLHFQLENSQDIVGSPVRITVDRRPQAESVLSCEKVQAYENQSISCTVVPRNLVNQVAILDRSEITLQVEDTFPGGVRSGYTYAYVPSLNNHTSTLRQPVVSFDYSILRFDFVAPISFKRSYIHAFVNGTAGPGTEIAGSPWMIDTVGPCFDFINPSTGLIKNPDAPSCIANIMCRWCTLDTSLTRGKCVHVFEAPSDIACASQMFSSSIEMTGQSAAANLQVYPERLSQFHVNLEHSHLWIMVTIISDPRYRFRFLTKWDDRPDYVFLGEASGGYGLSLGTTAVPPQTPPIALQVGPSQYSCLAVSSSNQSLSAAASAQALVTQGFCRQFFLAVVGDDLPLTAPYGPSQYTLQVLKEFDFGNFQCLEYLGDLSGCQLTLVGGATGPVISAVDNATVVRLVNGTAHQSGALYYSTKVLVYLGFEVRFSFRIHSKSACAAPDGFCAGADGFAILIQAQDVASPPSAMSAGVGGTLGFACSDSLTCTDGISTVLAIEFDTFFNPELQDPRLGDAYFYDQTTGTRYNNFRAPHVSVFATEAVISNSHNRSSIMHKGSSVDVPPFDDGGLHQVKIQFANSLLLVYIDDMERSALQVIYSLESIRDANGRAFIGFTASTGNVSQVVDIYSWRFCSQLGCVAQ